MLPGLRGVTVVVCLRLLVCLEVAVPQTFAGPRMAWQIAYWWLVEAVDAILDAGLAAAVVVTPAASPAPRDDDAAQESGGIQATRQQVALSAIPVTVQVAPAAAVSV